jgi:hypothetical protein
LATKWVYPTAHVGKYVSYAQNLISTKFQKQIKTIKSRKHEKDAKLFS